MKNKAVNALIEMGMPADIRGFYYISDAIAMIEKDGGWHPGRLTQMYRRLAELHDTTPSRVERAIRHAFSIVLTSGYLEAVEKYLTMQRTTTGNLLATFFLRLSQEG